MMTFDEITGIASSYRSSSHEDLLEVAERYRRRDERETLELAALAADVGIDDLVNLGLEPEENPIIRDAFERAYPGVSVESLAGRDDVAGMVNAVKGKYFEILIRDRLNEGGSVGGITLGQGEIARLAESANQPGWDLEIVDQFGDRVDILQAKATNSMAYVKNALESHPDITVIVPEGLDQFALGTPGVSSMQGVSLEDVTTPVKIHIGEWSESALTNAVHHGAEFALDSIPLVSIGVTALIEGRRVLIGRSTANEALRRGGKKVAEAAVWTSAGAALTNIGVVEPISAVAVVGARMYAGRLNQYVALADKIEARADEIRRYAPEQSGG